MHPTLYTTQHPYIYNVELNAKHAHIEQRLRASPHHSDFTDSPLESSSSGDIGSSRQHSRPSTSSGNALNSKMQQLMAPSRPHQAQQWPPMVIQLEEAPQEPPERTNYDTHHTRMDRIDTWRKLAGETIVSLSAFYPLLILSLSPASNSISSLTPSSQDHSQAQAKGVRAHTMDVSSFHSIPPPVAILISSSFFRRRLISNQLKDALNLRLYLPRSGVPPATLVMLLDRDSNATRKACGPVPLAGLLSHTSSNELFPSQRPSIPEH